MSSAVQTQKQVRPNAVGNPWHDADILSQSKTSQVDAFHIYTAHYAENLRFLGRQTDCEVYGDQEGEGSPYNTVHARIVHVPSDGSCSTS